MEHAMHTKPVGGKEVSEMLEEPISKLLAEKGLTFDQLKKEKSVFIREVKEKLGRTSITNLENELNKQDTSDIEDRAFVLPDGNIIQLDRGLRFKLGEVLVRPQLLGKKEEMYRDMIGDVVDSINRLDSELVSSIHSNIVLSGGCSLTKGIAERIERDIENMYSKQMSHLTTKLHAPANRAVAAWVGGSMMASIETFQMRAIKKSDYEDSGDADNKLSYISRMTI